MGEDKSVRECGDGGQVVMDVEHGGVQQRVDVVETLQPGFQASPALLLQLPELGLRQDGQGRGRGRHRRHWKTRKHTREIKTTRLSKSFLR